MKLPFIVASLLGNALLVAILLSRPALAPVAFRDFFAVSKSGSVANATPSTPRAAKTAVVTRSTPAWSTLHSDDPATFIAQLRAAGFPASLIRAIVTADVSSRYDARMRAILDPDPDAPFWRMRSTMFGSGDKRLEEMRVVQQERARALRDLFKDDFFATQEVTLAQKRQYGPLTRAQIDALQRIEEDYADMTSSVRAGTQGIILAEDREKLALLEREKRADLLTVLSPTQAADYEMRTSQTASMLRSRLATFDASESEYRAIYDAQVELNSKFPGGYSSINSEERSAAQDKFLERIRASLGEARFNDYLRDTNPEFQQLVSFAERDKVGRDVALQAYNLRENAARESNRIFDDPSLTLEQKRAALLTLGQTTRAQLLSTLGPAAGPSYVKVADRWLTEFERGGAVSLKDPNPLTIVSGQGTVSFSSAPVIRRLPSTNAPKR